MEKSVIFRSKGFKIAAGSVGAGITLVAAVAVAQVIGPDGTIHGCYDSKGVLRVLSAGQSCKSGEQSLEWNQQGQPGPQGAQGPEGPQGPSGPAGESGAAEVLPDCGDFSTTGSDMFLEIDGIPGESADSHHLNWINVQNAGFSALRPPFQPGLPPAGKPRFGQLCITKYVDKASTSLLDALAQGEHIPEAVLVGRKSGGDFEYLKITLQDVFVSSYLPGGGGAVPLEVLRLNYSAIKMEYTPQKPDGSPGPTQVFEYDLLAR